MAWMNNNIPYFHIDAFINLCYKRYTGLGSLRFVCLFSLINNVGILNKLQRK